MQHEESDQYLQTSPTMLKLPQLLEPVKEVADEDNNIRSCSPRRAYSNSQVEIVDPEVQLFDGADGGEEQ